MAKIVSVVSGKGGTGKSTFSAGIALSFAKLSSTILVVDLDIGLRSLDLLLGLENRVVFDIGDILDGKCKVDSAIVKHKVFSSLKLLCSPQSISKTFVVSGIIDIIRQQENYYDYIILDLPAGLGLSVMVSAELADLVCVVTTPDNVTIRDTRKVCDVISANSDKEIRLVINNVSKISLKTSGLKDLDELMDLAGIPLIGVIKEDKWINKKLGFGTEAVVPANEMQDVFMAISKRISGEYIPLTFKTL